MLNDISVEILKKICDFLLPIEIVMLSWCDKHLHNIASKFVVSVFQKRLKSSFEYEIPVHARLYGSFLLNLFAGIERDDIDINFTDSVAHGKMFKLLKDTLPLVSKDARLYFDNRPVMINFGKIQLIYHNVDQETFLKQGDMDICENLYELTQGNIGRLIVSYPMKILTRDATVVRMSSAAYAMAPSLRVKKYQKKGFKVSVIPELEKRVFHKGTEEYYQRLATPTSLLSDAPISPPTIAPRFKITLPSERRSIVIKKPKPKPKPKSKPKLKFEPDMRSYRAAEVLQGVTTSWNRQVLSTLEKKLKKPTYGIYLGISN